MKKVFLLLSFLLFLSLCACAGEKQKKHEPKAQPEKQNQEKTQEDYDEDLAKQIKEFIQKSAFKAKATYEGIFDNEKKEESEKIYFLPENIRVVKTDKDFKAFATLMPYNKYITTEDKTEYEISLNYVYNGSTIKDIDAYIDDTITIPVKPTVKLDIAELLANIPEDEYFYHTWVFDQTKDLKLEGKKPPITKETLSDIKIIKIKRQSDFEFSGYIEFTVEYKHNLCKTNTHIDIYFEFEPAYIRHWKKPVLTEKLDKEKKTVEEIQQKRLDEIKDSHQKEILTSSREKKMENYPRSISISDLEFFDKDN